MQKQNLVMAVSGKGGTGKTTIATLMVKVLSEGGGFSILAIDADPESNFSNTLGKPAIKTVGDITDEFKESIGKGEVLPTMIKKDFLESRIFEILEETPNFDFLAMGRTGGAGCYCAVNDFLTDIVDTISKNYNLTLLDMPAGLEHLSRRTDRGVDVLVIVTDPSALGFQTAKRINDLTKEVRIDFKKIYLIGNRFPLSMESMLKKEAEKIGVEYAGIIPEDRNVLEYNLKGRPLIELPSDSSALAAVKDILVRMGLT